MQENFPRVRTSVAFVLDHKLHHYRAPLFERLGSFYNVTVFHRGPVIDGYNSFTQEIVSYKKLGPFEFIHSLPDLKRFNSVVLMQNLRLFNLYLLPFKSTKSTLLMWGIGTSSSKGLGTEFRLSILLRNIVTLMYRGLALYSSVPVQNYWRVNRKKISIVGNSVVNEKAADSSNHDKNYFLFIGSLNKRKGLKELLTSFAAAKQKYPSLHLKIVGDGPEKLSIEQQILDLGLKDNVQLLGAVFDPDEKQRIFASAYCVISPLQAGLSVVESFSYGVPFVTSSSAITGGESQSIIHNVNGVLFDSIDELADVITSFVDGRRNSAFLGKNAFDFYQEHLAFELYFERFKAFIEKHS